MNYTLGVSKHSFYLLIYLLSLWVVGTTSPLFREFHVRDDDVWTLVT